MRDYQRVLDPAFLMPWGWAGRRTGQNEDMALQTLAMNLLSWLITSGVEPPNLEVPNSDPCCHAPHFAIYITLQPAASRKPVSKDQTCCSASTGRQMLGLTTQFLFAQCCVKS